MIDNDDDHMEEIRFSWLPIKLFNGDWVWLQDYIDVGEWMPFVDGDHYWHSYIKKRLPKI